MWKDAETHSQTLSRAWETQWKSGKKDCKSQRSRTSFKMALRINLPGLKKAQRYWSNNKGACMGLSYLFCIYMQCYIVLCSCETPNSGNGAVSEYFVCSWRLFLLLHCSSIFNMWEWASSYYKFIYHVWMILLGGCPFLKGKKGEWI